MSNAPSFAHVTTYSLHHLILIIISQYSLPTGSKHNPLQPGPSLPRKGANGKEKGVEVWEEGKKKWNLKVLSKYISRPLASTKALLGSNS